MKGKNGKPYKYSAKDRLTNTSSFPFKVNSVKEDAKKALENTLTKFRVVEEKFKSGESLDDSFFEGRSEKKSEKLKKKVSRLGNWFKEHKPSLNISFFRRFFLTVSAVCSILFIVLVAINFVSRQFSSRPTTNKKEVKVIDKKSSNDIDDNYLFIGDFHTTGLSFKKYQLDYHYVNGGEKSLTAGILLGDMKGRIYQYNPSVVFLEIGLIDIENGVSKEEFMEQYRRIINLIQLNRPYAKIYVESIYPINRSIRKNSDTLLAESVSNAKISDYNSDLKELCKEKNVSYLDLYSSLIQDDVLNSKYTDDGIHLNELGYHEILEKIKSVI